MGVVGGVVRMRWGLWWGGWFRVGWGGGGGGVLGVEWVVVGWIVVVGWEGDRVGWVVKLVVVLMVGAGLGGVLVGVGWAVYEVIVGDGVLGGGLLLEL